MIPLVPCYPNGDCMDLGSSTVGMGARPKQSVGFAQSRDCNLVPSARGVGGLMSGPPVATSSRVDQVPWNLQSNAGSTMPTRGGNARREMKPKPFTGEAGQWEEYLVYWRTLCRWNQWGDDIAVEALMLSLAGDAALYVHSLPSFTSLSHMELLDKLSGH